ncbi:MAG: hypothetical protein JW983_01155 [Elusimicrobia bacterium]|nr:hypothetical protein [Elusimicrobiota bacterium]
MRIPTVKYGRIFSHKYKIIYDGNVIYTEDNKIPILRKLKIVIPKIIDHSTFHI